jgi:hypothetical protein
MTTAPRSILAGGSILSFHSSLSEKEEIAAIATQALLYKLARENLDFWNQRNDPMGYQSVGWWNAMEYAIGGFPFHLDTVGNTGRIGNWTFKPPCNISKCLLSIMKEYIPEYSQEQLSALIALLGGGDLNNPQADNCLNFWNGDWVSSGGIACFGIGPSWRNGFLPYPLSEIATDITFFSISTGGADWKRVFEDGYPQEIQVFAGKYQIRFVSGQYYEVEDEIENRLGGSISDRIHRAPIG